ncbi:hypothetical protein, partial [Marinobacterium rhizophilum]|uniref:hypothetical protein n=1 Tax=Marinobacterium rhizophilum TaxID=420402 RepID=UPI001969CF37
RNAGRARENGGIEIGGEDSPSLASVAQLTICFIDDQNPAPIIHRCLSRLLKSYLRLLSRR